MQSTSPRLKVSLCVKHDNATTDGPKRWYRLLEESGGTEANPYCTDIQGGLLNKRSWFFFA